MASNKSSVSLIVAGKTYSLFKSARVSKSLDAIAGTYEFSIANKQLVSFPIKQQQDVQIKINNELVLSGLIDRIETSYDAQSHILKISGFDYANDVVKAGIFSNSQYATPITLKSLIERAITENGLLRTDDKKIKVVNRSARSQKELTIPKNIEISAESGDTVFSFIQKYAQLLNLVLGSSPEGGITIDEPTSPAPTRIALSNVIGERNNVRILAANSLRDNTNRYDAVIVLSQNKGGGLGDAGSGVKGLELDIGIRKTGAKVIISDSEIDKQRADAVAQWEVRKRRADAITYNCAVQGFSADGNQIWKPGMLVDIKDDFAGIEATMKIRSVDFTLDETGSFTSLSFVPENAYENIDVSTILSDFDDQDIVKAFNIKQFLLPVSEEEITGQ